MKTENRLFRLIAFVLTLAMLLQCVSCAISRGYTPAELEEALNASVPQEEITLNQEATEPKQDFSTQNSVNDLSYSFEYGTVSDPVVPGDPAIYAQEDPENDWQEQEPEAPDEEQILLLAPEEPAGGAALKNGTYSVKGTSIKFTFKDGTATFTGTGTLPNQVLNAYVDSVKSIVITEGVSIGDYAFAIMNKIQRVEIQSGCTQIGAYAFYECTALTELIIADSVAAIGELAFYGCTGLTSLPTVNGITEIPYGCFYGCTGLTELNIPDHIKTVGGFSFGYCENLKKVSLPEGLETLADEAFYSCKALTDVNIPANVQTIGNRAFSQCGQLSNVQWLGGKEMGTAVFADCISLSSITMPDSVTSTGGSTFYGCTNLQKVKLSSALTAVSIYDFFECNALTEIRIPDNVTTIGYAAFFSCDNLKKIQFPASYMDVGDYAFSYCNQAIPVSGTVYLRNVGSESFYGTSILKKIEFASDAAQVANEAFTNNTALENIVFHNETMAVGEYAFYGCSSLKSITALPVLTYVGEAAFHECSAVKSVKFTSDCEMIGPGSFQRCNNLTSVDFSDASAHIGMAAFSHCDSLQQVTLSESCTGLDEGVFYQCKNLKSVNFAGASVSVGAYAFAHCGNLTAVTGVENVDSLGKYAFNQCRMLANITGFVSVAHVDECTFAGCASIVAGFIPEGMDSVPRGLYNFCTNLQSIRIPDGTSAIEDYAFSGCEGLKTVSIPDSVERIGEAAFAKCSNLHTLSGGSGVETIEDLSFAYCENLKNAGFSSYLQEIGYASFYDCVRITDIDWISGLVRLGDSAFMNCSGIQTVVLPDYMDSIGKYAFENCTGLREATVGEGMDTLPAELFCGCTALVSVSIPSSVTVISESVFHECTSLQNIILPDDLMILGDGAFYHCKNLSSIEIPDTVKEIGRSCFKDCTALEEVVLPEEIRYIDDGTFYNCTALTSVTMPESAIRIGSAAFYQCSSLSEIALPENLSEIGPHAFGKCSKLALLELPGSVRTVGESCFSYCTSLAEIVLPKLISHIQQYAFYGCSALKSVDCLGNILAIGTGAFFGCSKLAELYLLGGTPISIGDQAFGQTGNDLILYGSELNEDWTAPAWEGPDKLLYRTQAIMPEVSGDCGVGVTWGFDTDTGILVISGSGEMEDYTSSNELPWANFLNEITSVIVEDEVTYIGMRAFSGYSALRSVHLGRNVTSIGEYAFAQSENLVYVGLPQNLQEIGGYAFYGCIRLRETTLPGNLERIGQYAFYGCRGLSRISISDSVTQMGDGAFGNCAGIETLIMPAGMTEVPEHGFSGCENLTNVILPANITKINQSAFSDCPALETVYILASAAEVCDYAFSGCENLRSLYFTGKEPKSLGYRALIQVNDNFKIQYISGSGWKAKTITTADGKVISCSAGSALQSGKCGRNISWSLHKGGILLLTGSGAMPNDTSGNAPWNSVKEDIRFAVIGNGITSVGNAAFSGCSGLEKVVIASTVTAIGAEAFAQCDRLTSVQLPQKLTSLGQSAFYHCQALTEVTLPAGLKTLSDHTFGMCTALKDVALNDSLNTIGYGCFYGCESIQKMRLPESLTAVEGWAFARCISLLELYLPESVSSLGEGTFFGCSRMADLSLSGSISNLPAYVFAGSGLTSVTLPDRLRAIGERAFWGCMSLADIDLNQVAQIGEAAFFESGLQSVTIPDQVTQIDPYAFGMCKQLQDITVAAGNPYFGDVSGVLYLADFSQLLQYPCGREDALYEVNTQTQSIGKGAFYGSSIQELVLPETLTTIGEAAFAQCGNLNRVNIPGNVTDLPVGAFGGCTALENVEFEADAPASIGADAFWNHTEKLTFLYQQNAQGWTNHYWTGPDGIVYPTRRSDAAEFEVTVLSSSFDAVKQHIIHNLRIDNNTNEETETSLYAALYNDGNMIAVTRSAIPLEPHSSYELSVTITGAEVDFATELKLFLLEEGSLYPLTSAVSIESEFDIESEEAVEIEIGEYISDPVLPPIPEATDIDPVNPFGGNARSTPDSTVSVRLNLETEDFVSFVSDASRNFLPTFRAEVSTGYQGASLEQSYTSAVDYMTLDASRGYQANSVSTEDAGAVPTAPQSRDWMPAASEQIGVSGGRKTLSYSEKGTFSSLGIAVSQTASDAIELLHQEDMLFRVSAMGIGSMENDASCTKQDDGSYVICVPWWGSNLELMVHPEVIRQAVLQSADTAQLTGHNLESINQIRASLCVTDSYGENQTLCTIELSLGGTDHTVQTVNLTEYAQIEEEVGDQTYEPIVYEYSTEADETAPVKLNTVSPTKGANGMVTVRLEGTMMEASDVVALVGPGGTIEAQQQYYFTHNKMYATFDLTNASDGVYDIRISGGDDEAVLSQSFTVDSSLPKGTLTATINVDKKAKINKEYSGSITYVNTGYTDVYAPVILIDCGNIELRPEEGGEYFYQQSVFVPNQDGLAGIVANGETAAYNFTYKVTSKKGFIFNAYHYGAMALDVAEEVKLTNDSSAEDILSWNVQKLTGLKACDFNQAIAQMACVQDAIGARCTDLNTLRNSYAFYALGTLTGGNLFQSTDLTSRELTLERSYSSDITLRQKDGLWGKGWISNYDITAQFNEAKSEDEINSIVITSGDKISVYSLKDGVYLESVYGKSTAERTQSGITVRYPDQSVMIFNESGKLTRTEDPYGNYTQLEYDKDHKLITASTNTGDCLTFSYTDGKVSEVRSEITGMCVRYAYQDDVLIAASGAFGTESYEYDLQSIGAAKYALTGVTHATGVQEHYQYDELGRLIGSETYAGKNTWDYSNVGSICFTDATGECSRTFFDTSGASRRIIHADGTISEFAYSEFTQLIQERIGFKTVNSYSYENGNMVSLTNPSGGVVSYTYDSMDNLTSVTDPGGISTLYNRNNLGSVTGTEYADGSLQSYSYDEKGRLATAVKRDGTTMYYTYNDSSLLTQLKYSTGDTIRYSYDNTGNLVMIDENGAQTFLQYNGRGELTAIRYPGSSSVEYGYDSYGNMTKIIARYGSIQREYGYEYDNLGRLTGSYFGGVRMSEYEYNPDGSVCRETSYTGAYTEYSYEKGMIASIENYSPSGKLLSYFRYTYDNQGNLISMKENAGTWTYSYDKLGQLVSAKSPKGETTTYTYDLSGNRLSKSTSKGTTAYEANALNQYTSFGATQRKYDLNGNLISQTDKNGVTTYEYDYQDRLIRTLEPDGTSTEYTYDVFGNRASIRVDGVLTEFINTPTGYGQALTAIRDGYVESDYIQGNGLVGRICYDQETDSLHFFDYSYNHLGSTSEITDESGNVVNKYTYDQEGKVISSTGDMENWFTYAGQYGMTDDGNGLYYNRARYISQETMSFTSPDPSGQSGGLNLYCYAWNNPVMSIDITGELPVLVVAYWAISIIIGIVIVGIPLAEATMGETRRFAQENNYALGWEFYAGYAGCLALGGVAGAVFKGVAGAAVKNSGKLLQAAKVSGKVVKDKTIKVVAKSVDQVDDYAKALAAEGEIASVSKEIAVTKEVMAQAAKNQLGKELNSMGGYFATLSAATATTGVVGSSQPVMAAPATMTNMDNAASYTWMNADTTTDFSGNCYTSNVLLYGGVEMNVSANTGTVLQGCVSYSNYVPLPNSSQVIPQGYETFLKNNPCIDSAGTPIIFQNNTLTTGDPSPGILDGLFDLWGWDFNLDWLW